MYKQQVIKRLLTLALHGLPCLMMSCESVSVCPSDDPSCKPQVILVETVPSRQSGAQYLLPQEQSTKLRLRIVKRSPDQKQSPYPIWLLDPKTVMSGRNLGNATYLEEHPDGGGIFEITVGKVSPPFAPTGVYQLRLGAIGSTEAPAPSQDPAPEVTVIKRTIGYQPPTVLAQQGQTRYQYPEANQMGFVGNDLVVFAKGLNSTKQEAQQLRRFLAGMDSLAEKPLTTYLSFAWDLTVRVGLGSAGLVFGQSKDSPALSRCPMTATSPSDCMPLLSSTLPTDSTALATSTDGKWAAYADKDGKLSFSGLSGTFEWKPLQSSATKPFVAMAFGELNGDQNADLVGVWQDGNAVEVRAFLGTGSAFAESAEWNRKLEGIGPMPISALAVGDVDTDGNADVVVARGLSVTVYQNVPGSFTAVWQSSLDKNQAGPKIGALAVGRLTGTDANQSLDIVAASNTPYDAMDKSNLYLHVLRPMQAP